MADTAASWQEVTQHPEYQALPPDQQEAARNQYFNQVVYPQVPDQYKDTAKAQFDAQTAPKPQESLPEQITHQLGLTTRAAIEGPIKGVAGLGDLANKGVNAVTSGVNSIAGTDIPQLGMPTDNVTQQMDAAGFSKPQNKTEEAVLGGSELATGLMAPTGIAKTGEALGEFKNLISPVQSQISNTLKPIANGYYNAARTSGGVMPAAEVDKWLNDISQYGQRKTLLSGNPVSDYIQTAEKQLRGKDLPVNDLIDYDKELGDLVSNHYNSNASASREFHKVQDSLRDFADNSSAAGTGDWGNALKSWSQGRKLDDISRMAIRAEASPNPSTAIQSAVRTMKGNPSRTRGWDQDELAALDDAGRTGTATALAKLLGNRLGPIATGTTAALLGGSSGLGAGIEGLGAAAVHSVVNEKAQNFAGNLQMRKLQALADTVKSKSP